MVVEVQVVRPLPHSPLLPTKHSETYIAKHRDSQLEILLSVDNMAGQ